MTLQLCAIQNNNYECTQYPSNPKAAQTAATQKRQNTKETIIRQKLKKVSKTASIIKKKS